jgi:hypothetical protein
MNGSCHCGAVRWHFEGLPEKAAACNCSICRRLGALWGYDEEGGKLSVEGETHFYIWNRKWLEFHFCPKCACVVHWRSVDTAKGPGRPIGFNLRLAAFDEVKDIPLIHHDTETKADLPRDGKCVADVWA